MQAVIQAGGKQYCVSIGEIIKIEKLKLDIGTIFYVNLVLSVGNESKILNNKIAMVKAKVIYHGLNSKVNIFKMKRRKHYHKHKGHRQHYTKIKIEEIVLKK